MSQGGCGKVKEHGGGTAPTFEKCSHAGRKQWSLHSSPPRRLRPVRRNRSDYREDLSLSMLFRTEIASHATVKAADASSFPKAMSPQCIIRLRLWNSFLWM